MTPDTAPFTVYAEHMLGGLAFAAGLVLAIGVIWHRFVERKLKEHLGRALGKGDAQVRQFVLEIEAWEAEQAALARRVR